MEKGDGNGCGERAGATGWRPRDDGPTVMLLGGGCLTGDGFDEAAGGFVNDLDAGGIGWFVTGADDVRDGGQSCHHGFEFAISGREFFQFFLKMADDVWLIEEFS